VRPRVSMVYSWQMWHVRAEGNDRSGAPWCPPRRPARWSTCWVSGCGFWEAPVQHGGHVCCGVEFATGGRCVQAEEWVYTGLTLQGDQVRPQRLMRSPRWCGARWVQPPQRVWRSTPGGRVGDHAGLAGQALSRRALMMRSWADR
jgi:hypothetical protein